MSQGFERGLHQIERIFNSISVFAIFILMAVAIVDILMRATGHPLIGTYKLSELLMVAIVFLGFSYTQAVGGNVKVAMLTQRLPASTRRFLDIFGNLLGMVLMGWMAREGWLSLVTSWQIREQASDLPLTFVPFRLALFLGVSLLVVRFGLETVKVIKSLLKKPVHPGVSPGGLS